MKKLALILAILPIGAHAGGAISNQYVQTHEAYVSFNDTLAKIGATAATLFLAVNHWAKSFEVSRLHRARRAAMPDENAARRRFAEEQARQQRENQERLRKQQDNQPDAPPAPQPEQWACPICKDPDGNMVNVHEGADHAHQAHEECLYNWYGSSQRHGSSGYRTHFLCAVCRQNIGGNILMRRAARYNLEHPEHEYGHFRN